VTVALAAICLVGQLSSVAHQVQVAHVTCPEHGELVHAEAGAPGQPAASESALPSYAAVPAPPPAHDHDHCLVADFRRAACVVLESDSGFVAQDEWRTDGPARDVSRVATLALFRLAPKTSPPV
jgi:hypothetical protein